MLEDISDYKSIGNDSVIVFIIDLENNTRIDEVVDLNGFEKRRYGELGWSNMTHKHARFSYDSETSNDSQNLSIPFQSSDQFCQSYIMNMLYRW